MATTGPNPPGSDSRNPYSELQKLGDEAVMVEVQRGNADAFAILFKRFHRLIHVTALRILRDALEAEDVTQSIFLEVFQRSGQFDRSRGTLKVWLLQYAYHRSMSRRNYLMARQTYSRTNLEGVEASESLFAPLFMARQESRQLTNELLAELPEAQRRTLEQVFFEGLTLRDVAERTGEPFHNVRHHYYRGLEKLRETLEEIRVDGAKGKVLGFGGISRAET